MALSLLDCSTFGPALPDSFVQFELEAQLNNWKLLRKNNGPEGKALAAEWDVLRRKLRALRDHDGSVRVANQLIEPLTSRLGYEVMTREEEVSTREGMEDGGYLLSTKDGASHVRAWTVGVGTDLDAPSRRGHAYRFSPSRIAQRVLLAKGERVGLLTDGTELRLLLCDPARPDSHLAVRLDKAGGWRVADAVPDSYRVLIGLASAKGVARIPELVEQARLAQTRVTIKLREQAKQAVVGFVQGLLNDPLNALAFGDRSDPELAKKLWAESLVIVYRLLFVLKLEASPDPARAFSFASQSVWQRTFSPKRALAELVDLRRKGEETGRMLGDGLRHLFRLFQEGIQSSELKVSPLGGMLFGPDSTPLLHGAAWSEDAAAILLDRLLWTPGGKGVERQRVHYGSLDVEDLGRVYEALLELEPGIAGEPMCRLRRQKLEVVVPAATGAPYRRIAGNEDGEKNEDDKDEEDEDDDDDERKEGRTRGKARVDWIEEIAEGRFYLRIGIGRKATGSYYTPHAFVRFLVHETLGPQVAERSPASDPNPNALLGLKVLDPAMGSGHFLVEACRFLGERLYEACRLCDDLACDEQEKADNANDEKQRDAYLRRAAELRKRVEDLPDPNDELIHYLPSRAPEGEETGLSQAKAIALTRRLVAVHCLYGVDKNPLAVELAKLSLWLESYAEGLPLTFLDHRLLAGDSLSGPFFEHLLSYPGSGRRVSDMFEQDLTEKLTSVLAEALLYVGDLEASVGKDIADIEHKRASKRKLDQTLRPLRVLASAWAGGVMLGTEECDDVGYEQLLRSTAERQDTEASQSSPGVAHMIQAGKSSVAYDLCFPEVFFAKGQPKRTGGFHAVLGNPPWDAIKFDTRQFLANFDLRILDAPTKRERLAVETHLIADPAVAALFAQHQAEFNRKKRANDVLFVFQKITIDGDLAGRQLDEFRVFGERCAQLLGANGFVGLVVPSAFHANAGAVGVRQVFLQRLTLLHCYSFENVRKLFEIDSRFKFALVVAQHTGKPTDRFECAFYIHDLAWLDQREGRLTYTRELIEGMGGPHLTFPELRSKDDVDVARAYSLRGTRASDWIRDRGVTFQKYPATLDSSKESHRFDLAAEIFPAHPDRRASPFLEETLARGSLIVHEGKTFRDYGDAWGGPHRYVLPIANAQDLPSHLERARDFQLVVRRIARSTDERTIMSTLLPPGAITANVLVDATPRGSSRAARLMLCGLLNSFTFDWAARQFVAATVNQFILGNLLLPSVARDVEAFVVHGALRLSCNHACYAPLWSEQLGDAWHEQRMRNDWPALHSEDERWGVRAAIDAVVADAYALSRSFYAHVLAGFSHKMYPKAAERCLAAFDELRQIGVSAFAERHDPYYGIPLNKALATPVIALPVASEPSADATHISLMSEARPKRSRKGKA